MSGIIRYDQVDISYNGRRVVQDVSFDLQAGEILGIAGESGSGKSTLLKAAMGLLGRDGLVTRGDIRYLDKNLPDLSERDMRSLCGPEIGMIFQTAGTSFIPIRTIGAQIREMMAAHGHTDKKAVETQAQDLLTKLGFTDPRRILDSYPFELSGGMQQRVGVARALVVNPEIIFADEPTGNLDSNTSREVMELMQKVVREQKQTLVMVTHDNYLAGFADRIFHIIDGKIVKIEDNRNKAEEPAAQKA